jgi:cellulose synthase/poly-beta-1,6-N-acetylglucosamine synthase-like glycosyltransferase
MAFAYYNLINFTCFFDPFFRLKMLLFCFWHFILVFMAKETRVLPFLDKVLLSIIFILSVFLLAASFFLPIVFTILFINFFLLFVLVLFFVLYLEYRSGGRAKFLDKYPAVSIIVPVYNSKNTIRNCIDSILSLEYPARKEIIVVDDCSVDGTREYLENVNGIKLIKLKQNSGKAVATNTGIFKAKHDFVVCIDSDTYPEKQGLVKVMGYFSDPKVGAVTCLILPDKKESMLQRIQFFEYIIGFGLWNMLVSSIDSMSMVPGPMTIFRKKFFEISGGYDDANLTEDMEIGLRLQKYGYKIKTCFEAVAYTDIPNTLHKLFKQRDRWYRGRVFNLMLHKSLFFNKQNTDFGFFALPYLFAMEIASVIMLFRIALLFLDNFFKFVAVETQVVALSNSLGIFLHELILPSSVFFFSFSYVLVFLFIYLSLDLVKYKPKGLDYLAILINILLYPLFISVVYFQSFIKEMFGVKGKWVRVST